MNFIKSIYFNSKVFVIAGIAALLFCVSILVPFTAEIAKLILGLLVLGIVGETIILYSKRKPITAERIYPKALSNGDENEISLVYINNTTYNFDLSVYEDLPYQFQLFAWNKKWKLPSQKVGTFNYKVLPNERGLYIWGNNYVIISFGFLGLVSRKLVFSMNKEVECFPSFLQFNKLKIAGLVSKYTEMDGTKVRRLGQSLEFEQIKTYNIGDDFRHINWKASAKSGELKLNQFQDERSQQIYCVLDMGRTMLQPFDKVALADYAINATLGLSKAILKVKDKVGIVNFYTQKCDLLKPKSGNSQFRKVNEMLFNLQPQETDASFEFLYKFTRNQIKQRSLLIIFSNFDNPDAVKRNLPYLKSIAKFHLVLLVMFKNTELMAYLENPANDLREIYTKTIAQSQINQQIVVAKELNKYGISTLISEPQKLSLGVINKYLEIKRKQMI